MVLLSFLSRRASDHFGLPKVLLPAVFCQILFQHTFPLACVGVLEAPVILLGVSGDANCYHHYSLSRSRSSCPSSDSSRSRASSDSTFSRTQSSNSISVIPTSIPISNSLFLCILLVRNVRHCSSCYHTLYMGMVPPCLHFNEYKARILSSPLILRSVPL